MKRFVSVYPPAFNSTYVKATTKGDGYGEPFFAVNPSKPLTGAAIYNAWVGEDSYQRFHIDLGSPIIINGVYCEAYHDSGANCYWGMNHILMQGSNSAAAFADLTYTHDTNWSTIYFNGTNQLMPHVALNISEPQFLYFTNSTAYQYYAFKFVDNWGDSLMGIRRIELLKEIDVAEISTSSIQNISSISF
ncbi:MAG TPA: hypothetical protein DET40_21655 [Lentisphaeria bacterium]|nr:hypothetical protein [Lentisphaeria bacterium]